MDPTAREWVVEPKTKVRFGSGLSAASLLKKYRVKQKGVMSQKEGNGGVHMGFALSDIRPKAFTSEKYFIIQKKGGYEGGREG